MEMDLKFSNQTMVWGKFIDPRHLGKTKMKIHSIYLGTQSTNPDNGSKGQNRILDANYETTDLEEMINP